MLTNLIFSSLFYQNNTNAHRADAGRNENSEVDGLVRPTSHHDEVSEVSEEGSSGEESEQVTSEEESTNEEEEESGVDDEGDGDEEEEEYGEKENARAALGANGTDKNACFKCGGVGHYAKQVCGLFGLMLLSLY